MTKAKTFAPLVVLLGVMLGFMACKLTTNGQSLSTPPGGSGEYLFATSNNQVWSFSVNATTGALGAATSVTGPALSQGIVANPTGTFLYVSDSVNDTVHVFAISSTGVLTEINGSPYSVGTSPGGNAQTAAGLAMDSAGKFLFATDLSNSDVAGFTVNSSSGVLTAIGTSPFSTGSEPANVVVDASNSFVYVSDFGSGIFGGVSAFTLNSSSGVLTPVAGSSPFTTVADGEPFGLATTGSFLYVSENSAAANSVAALSITSGTGGLGPILGTPFGAGSQPAGVAVTPSGKYLYVANSGTGDNTISGYSVNSSNGTLTAIAGSPFAATVSPWYLAVDPSGSFLYATNPADSTITGFTINSSNGALAQFSGASTSVGTQPVSLTVVAVP